MQAPATKIVDCSGCSLCCRGEVIMLHPEHGDDKRDYTTIVATNPMTGLLAYFIPQVAGACMYLVNDRCSIWEKRPAICRVFSCADAFKSTPRHVRRQRVREGLASQELYDRGQQVLASQGEKP